MTTAELEKLVTQYVQGLLFPTEVNVYVRFDALEGRFSYIRIKEYLLTDYDAEFEE